VAKLDAPANAVSRSTLAVLGTYARLMKSGRAN
jgi:hypothetical protein